MSGGTQVVIPVKRLSGALRRLGVVLSPSERALLQEAMLRDMLTACRSASGIAGVLVVSSDETAQRRADEAGARHLPDHDPPRGINAAVAIGQADARSRGHRALVLTADLPLVRTADVDALAAHDTGGRGMVLVPSHTGDGTNALLIDPADAVATLLGEDSRARHLAVARREGIPLIEHAMPTIGLDVDTPADLRAMLDRGAPAHTLAICRSLDLATRLEAVGRT